MKHVLTYFLLICLILSGCANQTESTPEPTGPELPVTAVTEALSPTQPITEETVPEETTEATTEPTEALTEPPVDRVFRNPYDGYQLVVRSDYDIDTSMAQVVTVFSKQDIVIELYRQPLTAVTPSVYVSYTNQFLNNTIDHIQDLNELRYYSSREYRVIAWHREKLLRLDDDKNYYISFDTVCDTQHYSIFVKSERKTNPDDYRWLLDTLEFFPPEESAPIWESTVVEHTWNEETTRFFQAYFSEDAPLTWGIYEPIAANGTMDRLLSYEAYLEYRFPILLTYRNLTHPAIDILEQVLPNNWSEDKIVVLTLQTVATADGGNMMYDILQGEYDDVLNRYAQVVRDFSHPVMVRLMNEMNGDWCVYSAYHTSKDTLIYKSVYRYIWHIFQDAGVDNAIWIWNPNEGSFPNFTWNHMLNYYPGDEYVDVVGLTAYNTGDYYWYVGETWKDFPTLYEDLYAQYCAHFSQPLMITEFSCAAAGGDKIAWTEQMLETLETYDRIKVAIWWDGMDRDPSNGAIARDYRIDPVLDTFKEYFAS